MLDRTRVLVVDDERPLVELISRYLAREGYTVDTAHDGETALELARDLGPDVIVLDLMLPGTDRLEVARQVRTFNDAYIIMLTARADEVDRIVGLSVGADDYVTKPFSPRELVARVQAMLRRPRAEPTQDAPEVCRFGSLALDPAAREVRVDGELVDLTKLESS